MSWWNPRGRMASLSHRVLSTSAPLNNGEDQVRGVGAVVIDAVDRLHEVPFRFLLNRSSCIGVAIKAREVGACDLHADTMPCFKNLRGCTDSDVQFVHLVRLQ